MDASPLFLQAQQVLKVRYRMPDDAFDDLALMANADTAKSAALTLLSRCTYDEHDRTDCLLMLELCALELHRE